MQFDGGVNPYKFTEIPDPPNTKYRKQSGGQSNYTYGTKMKHFSHYR